MKILVLWGTTSCAMLCI